tara:strand:- start:181 stop:1311 length:1131 start_codon:yes stop_codon:yes gene_type:complete
MKNYFKIKIIGESPSNLFLALILLKKGFKVEIYKNHDSTKRIREKNLFLISNTTKSILDDFNLWPFLKDNSYPIESILIKDISIFKKVNFSFLDINLITKNTNNIAWILNYSDISECLLSELAKFNNVFCETYAEKNVSFIRSDNSLNLSNILNVFCKKTLVSFFNNDFNSSLEFNVSLRGYVENRVYTISINNGLIYLFPIKSNLFRAKWIMKNSNVQNRLSGGNSLLLDNLSSVLPAELEVDQIFDDINVISNQPFIFKRIYKTHELFIIKDEFFKKFTLGIDSLNSSFSEAISIYNQINNNQVKKSLSFKYFSYGLFIIKVIKFILFSFLKNLLIKNNSFYNFLKRLIFYLLNKNNSFKRFAFKNIIYKFIIN